jgi:hypothetical protein
MPQTGSISISGLLVRANVSAVPAAYGWSAPIEVEGLGHPTEGARMQTAATRRPPIGGVLMLLGGALAAIGSFTTWAEVNVGEVSATAKGVDGSDGYITLVGGLVLIVIGIASFRTPRRGLAILAIVAGIIVSGVGIYDAATSEDSVLDAVAEDVAPQVGASVDEVRAVLEDQADSGALDISIQIGLYLVIAAGVLGTIGGVIAAATAPKGDTAPVDAAASEAWASPSAQEATAPPATGTPLAPPPASPPPPPGTPTD